MLHFSFLLYSSNPTPHIILMKGDDKDDGHILLDMLYHRKNFDILITHLLPILDPEGLMEGILENESTTHEITENVTEKTSSILAAQNSSSDREEIEDSLYTADASVELTTDVRPGNDLGLKMNTEQENSLINEVQELNIGLDKGDAAVLEDKVYPDTEAEEERANDNLIDQSESGLENKELGS